MKAAPVDICWHSGLSIFASGQFLKAVGDKYGWLGGIDDSGKLRCILPFTIIHRSTVRMVRFRVETIPLEEELEVEEETSFLNSAVEYFRSVSADIIIPATTNSIFRTFPRGAVAAPYGTYIIDLNQGEETIFNNFSSSHRRKIRLATKVGVEIVNGANDVKSVYMLVRDTFKRSSIPFQDYAAFIRMVESLGENVKILVAKHHDVTQGCVVIPFSNYSAYYVYGGSITEPTTGAMNLLHWEAIQMFHGLGVKRYDFCGVRIDPERGSKQEGLKVFKERFGPKLYQGYIWKYHISRIKSAVYSLGVRLLRGGDIVDAEGRKLRRS